MLSIDIQRKTYPDRGGHAHLALSGLRLSLAAGEFVCLVGPSGCGKSTLLNLIAGLDADFDGSIRLGARPATGATRAASVLGTVGCDAGVGAYDPRYGMARSDVAYVFQEPRLMPWLSVLDNVLLVAGEPADEAARDALRAHAVSLLEAMELGDVLDAWPGRLSGGMQRRVALARGFVNRPRLLLMDEPFVSLDTPTAARLRQMLLSLWAGGGSTVLFVTHDVREAIALGDRVCFLSTAPARVVLERRIDTPRPRDGREIERMLGELDATHPDLLAGLPAQPGETAKTVRTGEEA